MQTEGHEAVVLCTYYRPMAQDSVIGMQCIQKAMKLYSFAKITKLR